MKVKLTWQTTIVETHEATVELRELSSLLIEEIAEKLHRTDGEGLPYGIEYDLGLEDFTAEAAGYESSATRIKVETPERDWVLIEAIAPTPEEVGVPGVVHISDALIEARLDDIQRALDSVDQALDRADDLRDEERGK